MLWLFIFEFTTSVKFLHRNIGKVWPFPNLSVLIWVMISCQTLKVFRLSKLPDSKFSDSQSCQTQELSDSKNCPDPQSFQTLTVFRLSKFSDSQSFQTLKVFRLTRLLDSHSLGPASFSSLEAASVKHEAVGFARTVVLDGK